MKVLPVMAKHCATCPFHDAGWTEVRGLLIERAMHSSPICHQTGHEALKRGPGWIPREHVCRGARDLQLQYMHRFGVIAEPTDAAWFAKVAELKA